MQNVNTTVQPLLRIPGVPPPISPQELQRLGEYQQTAEYKARRDMWREGGEEMLGLFAG